MNIELFKKAIIAYQKKQSHSTLITIGNLYEIIQHYEDLLEKEEDRLQKVIDDIINSELN